jgi:predicted AAA+ superfamily ATPase
MGEYPPISGTIKQPLAAISVERLLVLDRNINLVLQRSIETAPVVLLQGARQTGKSTLMKALAKQHSRMRYLTLDDVEYYAAAMNNPQEFVLALQTPVIIDEAQRAPELFKAIKLSVDDNRKAGQFLLTGSAQVLILPKLSESLAGRLRLVTLYPLSQGEINGVKDRFIDFAFSKKNPQIDTATGCAKQTLIKIVTAGGFPEPVQYTRASDRKSWFQSYVATAIHKDINELAHIDKLSMIPKLLEHLSARLTGLLNVADLSSSTGIPQTSLSRYLTLLESIFLLHLLPAWSTNPNKRLVRAPKVYLNDSGIAAYVRRVHKSSLGSHPEEMGHLVENFVYMELIKQMTWSAEDVQISHFRTSKGVEVDFILENMDRKIVGIEVKSSTTIRASDAAGLNYLATNFAKQFHKGFILYCGNKIVPLAKDIWCLPVSALWQMSLP